MNWVFYISGAVALVTTLMVITRSNAAHAALYLVVSLLSIALVFYSLGAPFVAALEVIVYAGAIMVLFIFVIMMLNLGALAQKQERSWLAPRAWIGPTLLALVLAAELVYILVGQPAGTTAGGANALTHGAEIGAKQVAISMYGPYMLGVELASFLLMAGLVGAYHLGFEPTAAGRKAE